MDLRNCSFVTTLLGEAMTVHSLEGLRLPI